MRRAPCTAHISAVREELKGKNLEDMNGSTFRLASLWRPSDNPWLSLRGLIGTMLAALSISACGGGPALSIAASPSLAPTPQSVRTSAASAPVPSYSIRTLTGAIGVAAADRESCALLAEGTVRCWGIDWAYKDHRTAFDGLGLVSVAAIAVGDDHSCAVIAGGEVACWGLNDSGQLGAPISPFATQTPVTVEGVKGATGVSVGDGYSCAIVSGGAVDCWGAFGVSYDGSKTPDVYQPRLVQGLTGIVDLSVSKDHACALDSAGTVRCWGDNSDGQLGDDTKQNRSSPVLAEGVAGATAIATYPGSSCAVLAGGSVGCWGFGFGARVQSVTGVSGAKAISGAGSDLCVLLTVGSIECWGDNAYGQLGLDPTTHRSEKPMNVAAVRDADSIAVGADHVCATFPGGSISCWGRNSNGQLGDGTTTDSWTPVAVYE